MKKFILLLILILLLTAGCAVKSPQAQIAATTRPVYEFTTRLCEGTPLSVTQLVTEPVSCLHDYALNVRQVKAAEAAELVIINGAGLEDFMEDLISDQPRIDCSEGIALIESGHHHEHDGQSHAEHHHEDDPHIWLSPANAMMMAETICRGLSDRYPEFTDTFRHNLVGLQADLTALQTYGQTQLADLSCRQLITFHDGFAYLADSFGLEILEAVEEESGSEASAAELIHLIEEVEHHQLPAVFTEKLGSVSAAQIIAAETGADVYALDMIMHAESYFDSMYYNIDTLKGALG